MVRRVFLLLALLTPAVWAQTQPATAPAFHVTPPPGFVKVVQGGHTVLAEPKDQAWIQKTLTHLSPSTRPTTAPDDLATNLKTHRDEISKQMTKLLAIDDSAPIDQLLDDTIAPMIQRYARLQLPMVFMAVTRERLKQIVTGGWADPHVRFNPGSSEIEINRGVRLSLDGPADESLIVVLLPEPFNPDSAATELTTAVHSLDEQVSAQIANRAEADVQLTFIAFMAREGFDPLKLKPDQNWFSMGVCGVLSSYFAQKIDNIPAEHFISGLSTDRRDNPFRSASIDLMHPTPIADIRPESVPLYSDAYQRKAIRVVEHWLQAAGIDAPSKVIAAMRDSPPADGPALLKLIQEKTGTDLSSFVVPGQ